jgi:hypothetical protein
MPYHSGALDDLIKYQISNRAIADAGYRDVHRMAKAIGIKRRICRF